MTDIKKATEQIIQLHQGIITSARRSVQDAIKIGEIISEQKKLLPHGEFLPWVKTLPFDNSTGENYRRLFIHSCKIGNVPNLSEAYKQVETLEAQARQSDEEHKRVMIKEYRKTGIKPDGWDRSLDYALKKEEEEDRLFEERKNLHFEQAEKNKQKQKEEDAILFNSKILEKATDEFFKKVDERSKWKDKIRVSDTGKDDAFMDAIMDYLDTLENDNRRIEACNNIVKICRNISVQLQKIKEV